MTVSFCDTVLEWALDQDWCLGEKKKNKLHYVSCFFFVFVCSVLRHSQTGAVWLSQHCRVCLNSGIDILSVYLRAAYRNRGDRPKISRSGPSRLIIQFPSVLSFMPMSPCPNTWVLLASLLNWSTRTTTGPSSADRSTTSAFLKTHLLVHHCCASWWVSIKQTTARCLHGWECDKLPRGVSGDLFLKRNLTRTRTDYSKTWLLLVTSTGLVFIGNEILQCLFGTCDPVLSRHFTIWVMIYGDSGRAASDQSTIPQMKNLSQNSRLYWVTAAELFTVQSFKERPTEWLFALYLSTVHCSWQDGGFEWL